MIWLAELPWVFLIFMCLSLGLAPFNPPHIVEKLQMLSSGALVRPIDWFDLVMHGVPWVLLMMKVVHSTLTGQWAPSA